MVHGLVLACRATSGWRGTLSSGRSQPGAHAAAALSDRSRTRSLLALAVIALCCVAALPPPNVRQATAAAFAAEKAPLVDLNSASKAELVKLPGLGEAIAARIISGRPWASKYDLVVKKVVSRSTYDRFARFVVARQPETAK